MTMESTALVSYHKNRLPVIRPDRKHIFSVSKPKELVPPNPSNLQLLPSNQTALVKSELTLLMPIERTNYVEYSRFFEKFTDEENIANISEYERALITAPATIYPSGLPHCVS